MNGSSFSTGNRSDKFIESWGLGRHAGRHSRRRLMAILRTSVRILGINRKQRGLGLLGVGKVASGAGTVASSATYSLIYN